VPYYLPQWSSREQSAPRYRLANGTLALRIEADQNPWCPEFDGNVKVSSIQTGLYAGPVGSTAGQHRFNNRLAVRQAQPTLRTYTPLYGYFAARVRGVALPGYLCALWMIGFEEVPEESGEIVIFELFGDQITPQESEVRYGVHPWGDPALRDEFYHDRLPLDASRFHVYAVEWTPTHIDFYVDSIRRRTVKQAIAYPMQFMLGIYELPGVYPERRHYPREFVIDYFRAYQPKKGYGAMAGP
jgi:beta-glucanase (GH16 family)